ncbi:hypothetical protein [Kitasatospora albolonga]|uniref:hypothetical protein n=1 Tax=Kitasatospora albolonga TaxID=68173 RepID=UPI0035EA892D
MTTSKSSDAAWPVSPWRVRAERRRIIRALARPVVAEVAPKELPLFERRARSHFRPRLRRRRPLSIDIVGLATDVVTPAALSAAAGVLGTMSAQWMGRLASRLSDRVRRRRRGADQEPPEPAEPDLPPEAEPPAPTAAELVRWRQAALSGALRHTSDRQRAEQIADSVLAELVAALAAGSADTPAIGPGAPGPADRRNPDGNPDGDTTGNRDPDGDTTGNGGGNGPAASGS